mmetsp:Transcript_33660/g.73858  ORF Transcript_33660/g.73858 Transcript_33660/m.73858 type:complete len:187 (+) Transcript_33660:76-636(+)
MAHVRPRPRAIETVGRYMKGPMKPVKDKFFPEVERAWHLIDGYGLVMGRLASKICNFLQGKHKPTYSMVNDRGDFVVVVNVAKTVLTGDKSWKKRYFRYSGYPGGMHSMSYEQLFAKNPLEPLRRAVFGMLPKNRLREQRMRRLRLFPGPEHLHEAEFRGGKPAFLTTIPREKQMARPTSVKITRE